MTTLNKGQKITIWGILVALVGLIGLEVYSLANNHDGDTISEVINRKSKEWLFIPFSFGFLMGHWFWNLCTRRHYEPRRLQKKDPKA